MNLKDLLTKEKCFKLVCGAGNEDSKEVERLVAIYAKAGAHYFDLSANKEVVQAAIKGLNRVISKKERNNFFFNISIGIPGDPHVSKALIDQEICNSCGKCELICEYDAIIKKDNYVIYKKRCIGCQLCIEECPNNAISSYSEDIPLEDVLPPLIELGIHSLELHAVSDDVDKIFNQWESLNNAFDGILSLCIDESNLGHIKFIERIKNLIKNRIDYTTVIQADGAPMSGANNEPATTLQALATAQVVQRAKLPVFLLLSGGTNAKTAELARIFNISYHGIAIGSYARKIVREYTVREDFFTNEEVFNKAFNIAKTLVDQTKKYMG